MAIGTDSVTGGGSGIGVHDLIIGDTAVFVVKFVAAGMETKI